MTKKCGSHLKFINLFQEPVIGNKNDASQPMKT